MLVTVSSPDDCAYIILYVLHFQADTTHYYGYSYFRQVRDPDNKRGYFQKSVVVLTSLPYHSLFYELVKLMAPEYFENGLTALEAGEF